MAKAYTAWHVDLMPPIVIFKKLSGGVFKTLLCGNPIGWYLTQIRTLPGAV